MLIGNKSLENCLTDLMNIFRENCKMKKKITSFLLVVLLLGTLSTSAQETTPPYIISKDILLKYPVSEGFRSIIAGILYFESFVIFENLPTMSAKRFVIFVDDEQAGFIMFTSSASYAVRYTTESDAISSFEWSAKKGEAFLDTELNNFDTNFDYWEVGLTEMTIALQAVLSGVESGELVRRR